MLRVQTGSQVRAVYKEAPDRKVLGRDGHLRILIGRCQGKGANEEEGMKEKEEGGEKGKRRKKM